MTNLHPIPNRDNHKSINESILNQKGISIWFTGLSGSGKSTLAQVLEKKLQEKSFLCTILDGDNIRSGLNSDLGFSINDRKENIRRIAEVNKILNDTGIISINAFISPSNSIRNTAKTIIGKDNFIEIHVSTSLSVCESRDVKGLYSKARKGEIKNFTGIDSIYEIPSNSNFTIDTSTSNPEESIESIIKTLIPLLNKGNK